MERQHDAAHVPVSAIPTFPALFMEGVGLNHPDNACTPTCILNNTHTHKHTHTHTHARTNTHTHTNTHTPGGGVAAGVDDVVAADGPEQWQR